MPDPLTRLHAALVTYDLTAGQGDAMDLLLKLMDHLRAADQLAAAARDLLEQRKGEGA